MFGFMSASAVNSELAGNIPLNYIILDSVIEEKIVEGLDGLDAIVFRMDRFPIADDRSIRDAAYLTGVMGE